MTYKCIHNSTPLLTAVHGAKRNVSGSFKNATYSAVFGCMCWYSITLKLLQNSHCQIELDCHTNTLKHDYTNLFYIGPSQAKISCKDNGDGSADVTYMPTLPGEYAVHVLCENEDIPNSPFMAMISPANLNGDPNQVCVAACRHCYLLCISYNELSNHETVLKLCRWSESLL